MIQETLLYHSMLIKIFFLFLFMSLALPWLFRGAANNQIRAVRISFFLFSALLTMVAFSGMVLMLIAGTPWSIQIGLMVGILAVLGGAEIARSRKLTRLWREKKDITTLSSKLVAIEIVITLCMIVIMVMEKA